MQTKQTNRQTNKQMHNFCTITNQLQSDRLFCIRFQDQTRAIPLPVSKTTFGGHKNFFLVKSQSVILDPAISRFFFFDSRILMHSNLKQTGTGMNLLTGRQRSKTVKIRPGVKWVSILAFDLSFLSRLARDDARVEGTQELAFVLKKLPILVESPCATGCSVAQRTEGSGCCCCSVKARRRARGLQLAARASCSVLSQRCLLKERQESLLCYSVLSSLSARISLQRTPLKSWRRTASKQKCSAFALHSGLRFKSHSGADMGYGYSLSK